MKKIAITAGLLVLVLGLALVGAPYWFGMKAEEVYREHLHRYVTEGDITLIQEQYERGLFDSTAEVTLASTGVPLKLTIRSEIRHGPLPRLLDLDLSPVLAATQSEIRLPDLPKAPAMKAVSLIGFGGVVNSQLELPAGQSAGPEGATVQWQAVTGQMHLSPGKRNNRLELTLPQLVVKGEQGTLTVNRVTLNVDQRSSPSGLEIGEFGFSVGQVLSQPDNKSIEGLRLKTTADEANGEVTIGLTTDFKAASDGATRFGPGQLSVQVRRLDAATLAKMRAELRAAKKPAAGKPGQADMLALGKGLEHLGQLAKKTPELEVVRLSLTTPDGELQGKGKLAVDGASFNLAENPLMIVAALSAQGEASIPSSLVRVWAERGIREQIQALHHEGKLSEEEVRRLTPERLAAIYDKALPRKMEAIARDMNLVQDGNAYKLSATFKQGRLLVNGKPVEQSLRLAN